MGLFVRATRRSWSYFVIKGLWQLDEINEVLQLSSNDKLGDRRTFPNSRSWSLRAREFAEHLYLSLLASFGGVWWKTFDWLDRLVKCQSHNQLLNFTNLSENGDGSGKENAAMFWEGMGMAGLYKRRVESGNTWVAFSLPLQELPLSLCASISY